MRRKEELTISEIAHRERLRVLYCGIFVVTVFVWVCRFLLDGLATLAAPALNYYVSTALSLGARAISIFLPFFVFQKILREPFSPIFREKPRSEHPILRCMIGVLAVCGLTLGGMSLAEWLVSWLEGYGIHSAISAPNLGADLMQTVYYVVLSAIFYSFAYEVAFRGIAVRAMSEENRLCAVIVSGLAYALSDGDLYGIVVRLLLGMLIGAFYLRVRSVWACILLQAASQVTVALWWIYLRGSEFSVYIVFFLLTGFALGLAAAFFVLFFPRRTPDAQITSNQVALRQVFGSFGVYLMIGLVAFNLLVFTFSTDASPADPLLQPTPTEGVRPPLQFDRDEELGDIEISPNP